jgi:hypothetical protein
MVDSLVFEGTVFLAGFTCLQIKLVFELESDPTCHFDPI